MLWVAEPIFLSLNNWGLNFLQNECSKSFQIYLSPEKLRKMFSIRSSTFEWAGWNPSIYNLIRWFAGPMGQMNRQPSVWCSKNFFFIVSYRLRHSKLFIFVFIILLKNIKINWNDFCKELCKIFWKKKKSWNIRCLVDDSFVPSARQTSVLNCKLTDFWTLLAPLQGYSTNDK